jgi:hypothetical protein
VLTGVTMFALRGGFSAPHTPAASPTADPSAAVTVTPPPPAAPAARSTCAALGTALPATLGSRARRPVAGAPDRVVAWGAPPVVLRCGVAPVTVPPDTNKQFEINGVRWYAVARGPVVVFTTTDRRVPVEVTVPAATAGNPADVVADLSVPVGTRVPASR